MNQNNQRTFAIIDCLFKCENGTIGIQLCKLQKVLSYITIMCRIWQMLFITADVNMMVIMYP